MTDVQSELDARRSRVRGEAFDVRALVLSVFALALLVLVLDAVVANRFLGGTALAVVLTVVAYGWYLGLRRRRLPWMAAVALAPVALISSVVTFGFLTVTAFNSAGRWSTVAAMALTLALAAVVATVGAPAHDVYVSEVFAATRRRLAIAPRTRLALATFVVTEVASGLTLWRAQIVARHDLYPVSAFAWFWVGITLAFLPLCLFVVLRGRSNPVVTAVVVGVVSYVPAFVRSPLRVFSYDEYGHLGEADAVLTYGRLFTADTTVTIGPKYPGFELVVVTFKQVTTWPLVASGQIAILLFHIAVTLGVAALAALTMPKLPWAVGIAPLLYAVSPQFVQFDALFSYESQAMPLAIGLLVLVAVIATSSGRSADARRRWVFLLAAWILLCLTVTHHLTTFLLSAVLLVVAISAGVTRLWGRFDSSGNEPDPGVPVARTAAVAVVCCLGVLAAFIVYAEIVNAGVASYLGAFPRSAYASIRNFISPVSDSLQQDPFVQRETATRGIFEGTSLPWAERIIGVATQVLIAIAWLVVVWRGRRDRSAWRWTFRAMTALYLLSLPLSFIAVASSGAHRTWAVLWIGVALTMTELLARPSRTRPGASVLSPFRAAVVCAAVSSAIVASYATSVNLYNRFDGPYVLGADGRDDTPDVRAAADWLRESAGPGAVIATTRRTGAVFAAYALTVNVGGPTWDVFYPLDRPAQSAINSLKQKGVEYLVVDRRLATSIPTQSYFSPFEPTPPATPLPEQSVSKFDSEDWLMLVHRTGNVAVYKLT